MGNTDICPGVVGTGREVVLMYMQPAGMGVDYQAVVDVLFVMQVWQALGSLACQPDCLLITCFPAVPPGCLP